MEIEIIRVNFSFFFFFLEEKLNKLHLEKDSNDFLISKRIF